MFFGMTQLSFAQEIQSELIKPQVEQPKPQAPKPLFPAAKPGVARIFAIDEESLLNGRPRPVKGAAVHWITEGSGLVVHTLKNGSVKAPYDTTHSARFVITAPGYIPAVGYAINNTSLPVILFPQSRIKPILDSLGVAPDPSKTLVIGKILDRKLRPVKDIKIEGTFMSPFKSYYSIGSFGLYHRKAVKTGPQGDFLVSGFSNDGLEYILPSQEFDKVQLLDWPAAIYDFQKLPQIVSVTLQEGIKTTLETDVIDAMTGEAPAVQVRATVGGQRKVQVANEKGRLKLEQLELRGNMDLVELHADGYLKTWLNFPAHVSTLPPAINLFSRSHLQKIFSPIVYEIDFGKGFVFGNLNTEQFTTPIQIRIFRPDGVREKNVKILYFDEHNQLIKNLPYTHPKVQSFAVANLPEGEWHIVAVDMESRRGTAIQVVRVQNEAVSLVQF